MQGFNELVSELTPFFSAYGFTEVIPYKNAVVYQSDALVVSLSFNDRERSISVFVGKEAGEIELSAELLKRAFYHDAKLLLNGSFANELREFFTGKGQMLLMGDVETIKMVRNTHQKMSEDYTNRLIQSQMLADADKAWLAGNYRAFLDVMDKLAGITLPKSYLLKQKIAREKLSA
jgi:hypothetical protein